MAQVNQVVKKGVMTKWEVVKYQLLTYCFIKKIKVSDAELECLVLSVIENDDLNILCRRACELNIFKTPQSVRNSLNKLEKKNLIFKTGKNKKKLFINNDVGIIKEGNILLNYNFLSVETN